MSRISVRVRNGYGKSSMTGNIEAIFFDMAGTLFRPLVKNENLSEAIRGIVELIKDFLLIIGYGYFILDIMSIMTI